MISTPFQHRGQRRFLGPLIGSMQVVLLVLLGMLMGSFANLSAQDELRKVQREYIDVIQPILKESCFDCHNNDDSEAGLNLESFETLDQLLNARKKWKKVLTRVTKRDMPPEDASPLSDDDHKAVLDWLDNLLTSVDCSITNPGRVTIRRLNRNEYRNTIRDLTGVDYQPADSFPGDDVGYGFNNIADVLSLPPILMEKYLDAAEEITSQIIVDPTNPVFRSTFDGSRFRAGGANNDGGVKVMTTNATASYRAEVPESGTYKMTLRAWGSPAKNEWPEMVLKINGDEIETWEVEAEQEKPGDYTTDVELESGENLVEVSFTNDLWIPQKADRNLFFVHADVSGPIGLTGFQEKYLGSDSTDDEKQRRAKARKAINRFASRAYRRRVSSAEIDRLLDFYDSQRDDGESHAVAFRHTMQAILVSPYFIYKVERPTPAGETRLLSNFELASSLSYFLWNTMPDDELLRIASEKDLSNLKSYQTQIKRLLKDKKSTALVASFVAQWLQLEHLEHVKPDPDLFPGVDAELKADMATETKMLIADMIRRDASIFELLESKYSFINDRLAKHYGIKNVKGSKFRKVNVSKNGRTGLMTQASILTLTSNPNRTSPVLRGKWIMENLLGDEPPPPDPAAMQLEDQAELTGTLRERMEQHREDPNCAICHQVMDQLGFALENYDAVGKWREKDGEDSIDASGELPDGTVFNGAKELQQTLKTKMREDFARCLTEKMLIYALGRGLEYFDECAVDKIMERLKKDDYRFSSLIHAVATSDPFLRRQGPVASNE